MVLSLTDVERGGDGKRRTGIVGERERKGERGKGWVGEGEERERGKGRKRGRK